MIILGGANKTGATNEVFRYDIHGNEFPLPKLTTPRYEFGCSGYYNNVGNLVSKKSTILFVKSNYGLSAYEYIFQVLVVTGGSAYGAEHLEVGVDLTWTSNAHYTYWDISCADANNDVYCLQGILTLIVRHPEK